MTHISVNKLFEQLPEEDLVAIQIYFDDFVSDFYDKTKMCVAPLTMTLVHKDRKQTQMEYKDLRELFPEMRWIKVPQYLFKSITPLNMSLRKIIVDAERVAFRNKMFYHRCFLKDNIDQSKLKSLQKEREQYNIDRIEMMAKAANRSEKEDFDFDDII